MKGAQRQHGGEDLPSPVTSCRVSHSSGDPAALLRVPAAPLYCYWSTERSFHSPLMCHCPCESVATVRRICRNTWRLCGLMLRCAGQGHHQSLRASTTPPPPAAPSRAHLERVHQSRGRGRPALAQKKGLHTTRKCFRLTPLSRLRRGRSRHKHGLLLFFGGGTGEQVHGRAPGRQSSRRRAGASAAQGIALPEHSRRPARAWIAHQRPSRPHSRQKRCAAPCTATAGPRRTTTRPTQPASPQHPRRRPRHRRAP